MMFATATTADAILRGRFGGPDLIISDSKTLEVASALPPALFFGLALLTLSAAFIVGVEMRAERND